MDAKPILKSKTIVINGFLVAIASVLALFGIDIPDGLVVAVVAAIPLINIILRLVTKKPITLVYNPTNNNQGRAIIAVCLALCMLSFTALTGCAVMEKIRAKAEVSNAELKAKHCPGEKSIILDNIPHAKKADIVLTVGDYAVLQNNPQLVPKVAAFFNKAKAHLDDTSTSITGQEAVAYMTENIKFLQGKYGKHLFFISQLAASIDVPDPLTPCDRKLLKLHIENIENKVFPFVGE